MEDYGVEAGDLWDIVEVVPSVTLEILKLQHEGYAYIKV
jgi:intracellular sulfur oxidation DsrE/DsrF family protein